MSFFREYNFQINSELQTSGRKILWLLDNASCHSLSSKVALVGRFHGLSIALLSNVMLVYLPANTTSVLQPLDQGIIAVFKRLYKQQLVNRRLSDIEQVLNKTDGPQLGRVNIRQAFEWGCITWNAVSDTGIHNCWKRTGILPTWVCRAYCDD